MKGRVCGQLVDEVIEKGLSLSGIVRSINVHQEERLGAPGKG